MKKVFLIILLSTVLVASCNVAPAPENTDNLKIENYYPITENTKYFYQGEGNEYATYTVTADYIADGKMQTRTNNGGTEIVNVIEVKDDKITLLHSRPETYFRYNFSKNAYENGKIMLKGPLKEGASWDYDESTKAKITSLSKEVVTSMGNFNAIEVTLEGKQGKTINYYAKDKGLIKTISSGEGYEVSSTLSSIENNVPLMQTLTVYYPNVDGIHLNKTDVELKLYTNEEPEHVLEKTIKDLSVFRLFSTNTKVNKLDFNEGENSVHFDLSKDFVMEMSAGAGFESMILQSIANTLGQYYGVQNVYLTIDEGPYESGHIILEKGEPLVVNYNNVE